jgi:hypothetical protein
MRHSLPADTAAIQGRHGHFHVARHCTEPSAVGFYLVWLADF